MSKKDFLLLLHAIVGGLLLLSASASRASKAQWDYAALFRFRTHPIGGTAMASLGLGIPLWQTEKKDNKSPGDLARPRDPRFGFLRFYYKQSATGVWYQSDGGLQIAPIAPLVFSLGQAYNFRLVDASSFDCQIYQCQGVLRRSYLDLKLGFAFGSLFGLFQSRHVLLKTADRSRPLADEMSVLPGGSHREKLQSHVVILGYDFKTRFKLISLFSFSRMRESRAIQQQSALGVQYQKRKWSYTLGAGTLRSAVKPIGLNIVGMIRWQGKPGIGLF